MPEYKHNLVNQLMPEHQQRVLNLLVDRYEKSPAFRGEAKVHRAFSVTPRQVYPAYLDNFESVEKRDQFEREMEALARSGLVELLWDRPPRRELLEIRAVETAWDQIYRLLDRRNARDLLEDQLAFYSSAGETSVTRCFCREEADRLSARKKARYPLEKARELVRVADAIVNNHRFLLERELSMSLFGDSKSFEKHWRKPVVDLLLRYGDLDYPLDLAQNPDNEREIQAIVLGEHGIEPNPSYIFLKGKAILRFADGMETRLHPDTSFALQSSALNEIDSVSVSVGFVLTVENLTAYHRVCEPEGLCLFLSGFHQAGMEKLLRLLNQGNPGLTFHHFGDLDPAGIQILKHLRSRTGLPIQPWHMDIEDLETYQAWGKPLEAYDLTALRKLKEDREWAPVARWMDAHQLKLEQEWIAWSLYGSR